ncbi:MAG: hypothetical protein AAF223_16140, partial [Bacteroidota bacterium]
MTQYSVTIPSVHFWTATTFLLSVLTFSCSSSNETTSSENIVRQAKLFTQVPSDKSGIHFVNTLE